MVAKHDRKTLSLTLYEHTCTVIYTYKHVVARHQRLANLEKFYQGLSPVLVPRLKLCELRK